MTSNIQLSGKATNGIIFVVGGDTYDDFYVNLVATLRGDTATADSVVTEAARLIVPPSVGGLAAPTQQQAVQTLQQAGFTPQPPAPPAPRQPSNEAPGGQPPLCEHGYAREWKTGNKNGKTWKAWFCPLDKGEACSPQWVR